MADHTARMRDAIKLVLALVAVVFAVGAWLADRPVAQPPGVLAADDPQQDSLDAAEPLELRGYRLQPRATFELRARVLSAERYRWDAGASLAPVDLALGWGPMSDTAILERFRITQGARFYTLYPREGAIDLGVALRHSANMHLVPADGAVLDRLEAARPGRVVTLRGQLVDAARPDGFTWKTSLRRDDSGAGACELFLVESVSLR